MPFSFLQVPQTLVEDLTDESFASDFKFCVAMFECYLLCIATAVDCVVNYIHVNVFRVKDSLAKVFLTLD